MSTDESPETTRSGNRLTGLERLLVWGSAGLVVLGVVQVSVTGNATPRWVGAVVAVLAACYLVVMLARMRGGEPRD